MPRPSNTSQRRRQITEGLIKVMSTQGYEAASIGKIARAAHLTPGLVHYHFKNKQAILLEVLDELTSRHESSLEARLGQAGEQADEQLAMFIDAHLKVGPKADPEALACWVVLSKEALRREEVRDPFQRALSKLVFRLARIIAEGVRQRVFSCEEPVEAASALVATIQGYYVLAATARELIPKGSAASSTKKMAGGLLQPSARETRA